MSHDIYPTPTSAKILYGIAALVLCLGVCMMVGGIVAGFSEPTVDVDTREQYVIPDVGYGLNHAYQQPNHYTAESAPITQTVPQRR